MTNDLYKEVLEDLCRKRDLLTQAITAILRAHASLNGGESDVDQWVTEIAKPEEQAPEKPKRKYTRRKIAGILKAKQGPTQRHGRPGKFPCYVDSCGRGFRSTERRALHVKKDHAAASRPISPLKFGCYECPERFATLPERQAHYQRNHPDALSA